MNPKAALGLSAGALAIGLFAGLALGGNEDGKPAKAIGAGPTKSVAGVPVGYQHSKVGAVRAALAYQAALGRLADPKGPGDTVFDAITATSDRKSIAEAMAGGIDVVRKALGDNGFMRSGSVGYQLKAYQGDTAEVVIWGVSVLSQASSSAPQSGWTTTTLQLKWAEDDWKLAAPPAGADGPTPALQEAPTEPASVAAFAASLEEAGDEPTD